MALKKTDLYSSLWRSCDELRGGMDASQYEEYILTLLFMRYVSDKVKGPKSLIEVPTGGSFGRGTLRLDDLAYIDEATHKTFPVSEVRAGDVLLNITGASIGRSAVATPELDGGNVNQHVCEIRLDTQLMDPQRVSAVLNSGVGQDQIDAFQAGGNRQGLNFHQIGSISVPAPEIGKQRANGLALGDIDAVSAALRLRLRKAQSIKQGMIQQLLTGRTRLPVPEPEP